MNDNHYIVKGKIYNSKNKKVASLKDLKKNHQPIILHEGERVINDKKKLDKLEKKYQTKLYPRRKI